MTFLAEYFAGISVDRAIKLAIVLIRCDISYGVVASAMYNVTFLKYAQI